MSDPCYIDTLLDDVKKDTIRRQIARCLANSPGGLAADEIVAEVVKRHRKSHRSRVSKAIRKVISDEILRRNGAFVRLSDGSVDLRVRFRLKNCILESLKKQGLEISRTGVPGKLEMHDKSRLRNYHVMARATKYAAMKDFLAENEFDLIESFAEGRDIDIESFSPVLKVVKAGSRESDLFRYASLLWSVPVSEGFGRRVRFMVMDSSNDKLVGIFALGDPVFNLRCRDKWIGWNVEQRKARLYNVMDAFVLGAVPPYNNLLCGKLIAMIASSTEVGRIVEKKYKGTKTVISKKEKDPRPVLLTTGSALGKSSLYDRIKFRDEVLYNRIGVTNGWGHFQFNGSLFRNMTDFVALGDSKLAHANRFGHGPNWKLRISRRCLEHVGLNKNVQQHGIAREIYAIPLAENCREYLRGEDREPEIVDRPFKEVCDYFVERWMMGRSERVPSYRRHKRKDVSEAIHSAGRVIGGNDGARR